MSGILLDWGPGSIHLRACAQQTVQAGSATGGEGATQGRRRRFCRSPHALAAAGPVGEPSALAAPIHYSSTEANPRQAAPAWAVSCIASRHGPRSSMGEWRRRGVQGGGARPTSQAALTGPKRRIVVSIELSDRHTACEPSAARSKRSAGQRLLPALLPQPSGVLRERRPADRPRRSRRGPRRTRSRGGQFPSSPSSQRQPWRTASTSPPPRRVRSGARGRAGPQSCVGRRWRSGAACCCCHRLALALLALCRTGPPLSCIRCQ